MSTSTVVSHIPAEVWDGKVEEFYVQVEGWVANLEGWGCRRLGWDDHLDRLLIRTPKGEFMIRPIDEPSGRGVLEFYSVDGLEGTPVNLSDDGWHWYQRPADLHTSVRRKWDREGFQFAVDFLADRR